MTLNPSDKDAAAGGRRPSRQKTYLFSIAQQAGNATKTAFYWQQDNRRSPRRGETTEGNGILVAERREL